MVKGTEQETVVAFQ